MFGLNLKNKKSFFIKHGTKQILKIAASHVTRLHTSQNKKSSNFHSSLARAGST